MKKFTLYKHLHIFCVLLVGVFSISATAQTVLSEDFSTITNGNSVETGMSSTPWTGNANFPAESLQRVYQAGGAVRIGTSAQTGYMATTLIDLSQNGGNFSVTFDVKGWTTVEGAIKITHLSPNGDSEQTVTYSAEMADPFETKTVSFTGGTESSMVKIETTLKRAFIDNVVITSLNCDDIAEPDAQAQSFCGSATVADFIPYGEGIQWYASETGGTPLTTTDVIVGGTYYVSQTIGTCESDRVPVSIAVNAIPAAPDADPQTVCGGSDILDLSANGADLQWYTDAEGGDALAPGAEVATATYYVSQTINGCESARTAVDIIVNSPGPPEAVPQVFCNSAIVEELVAVGTDILWYTSAEGGTALDPADVIVEGTYYASQTIDGCESERKSVLVDIIEVDMPQGQALQQFTAGQTLADLVVTGENIIWYSDSALTTEISSDTVLTDGATYYAVASQGLCLSAPFIITVDDPLSTHGSAMDGLAYYPNPAKEVLYLSYNENLSSVIVYNLLGQAISEKALNAASAELDMSGLSAGSYVLKITSGKESKIIKIIKM